MRSPEDKVAAEVPAPFEFVGHVVVGEVPSGVLHERHGDSGVDWVLGVRAGHGLVLEEPLLPMRQGRPLLPLVLQLRPRQGIATVMPPNLQSNINDYTDSIFCDLLFTTVHIQMLIL